METYDGFQLVIQCIENMVIRGSGKDVTTVSTEPRFGIVLILQACTNVVMEDFTAGHTQNAQAPSCC